MANKPVETVPVTSDIPDFHREYVIVLLDRKDKMVIVKNLRITQFGALEATAIGGMEFNSHCREDGCSDGCEGHEEEFAPRKMFYNGKYVIEEVVEE